MDRLLKWTLAVGVAALLFCGSGCIFFDAPPYSGRVSEPGAPTPEWPMQELPLLSEIGEYKGDTNLDDTTTDFRASCGGTGTLEQIWRLSISRTTDVTLFVEPEGDFDPVIYVRKGYLNGAEVGCNDNDRRSGFDSRLALKGLEPGDYYVFVDGQAETCVGSDVACHGAYRLHLFHTLRDTY